MSFVVRFLDDVRPSDIIWTARANTLLAIIKDVCPICAMTVKHDCPAEHIWETRDTCNV